MNSKVRWVILAGLTGGLFLSVFRAEGAEVKGHVVLEGSPPESKVFTIPPKVGNGSTEGCGSAQKRSPQLLVDPSGGVEGAVAWFDLPAEDSGEDSNAQIILDQRECVFTPHTVLLTPGQFLTIKNSDPVLHNVRIFRESRAEDVRSSPVLLLHQWQKPDSPEIPWLAPEPGRYVVRCGIHPWMYAWVVVLSTRACALSDSSGQFRIPTSPPGKHTLHLWHETLGRLDVPVEVGTEGVDLGSIRFSRKEKGS